MASLHLYRPLSSTLCRRHSFCFPSNSCRFPEFLRTHPPQFSIPPFSLPFRLPISDFSTPHFRPASTICHLKSSFSSMDTIIVFDFDCTIIDVDSDNCVAEQLGATPLFDSLRARLPWNDMMDALMEILHKQGKTISDIEKSLHSVPLQEEKISAIKAAHALGCELRIVSDANAFFIKTILDKYEISHLFTQIHTNPAYVDDCGRLHIGPFHPKSEPPHGCELCPPNMCKGRVIDEIRAMIPAETKRIIYAGDGRGDYCPSLRLSVGDVILPREGFPLKELLIQSMGKVKASVYSWNTAKDMEDVLLQLLHDQQMEKTEQDYGTCGACATCGMPQKLDQAIEVVSQSV